MNNIEKAQLVEKARKDDAPNFEKVTPEECTHTGYYVPMGYDSFPLANGTAVLVSFGVVCMRCGKIWPHVQVLENPLAKMGKKNPGIISQ